MIGFQKNPYKFMRRFNLFVFLNQNHISELFKKVLLGRNIGYIRIRCNNSMKKFIKEIDELFGSKL